MLFFQLRYWDDLLFVSCGERESEWLVGLHHCLHSFAEFLRVFKNFSIDIWTLQSLYLTFIWRMSVVC